MRGHEESPWHEHFQTDTQDFQKGVGATVMALDMPLRLLVAMHGPQCRHLTCRGVLVGVFTCLL